MRRSFLFVLALGNVITGHAALGAQTKGEAPQLVPTAHQPLPAQPSNYWLVPDEAARAAASRDNTPLARFARGAKLIAEEQYTAGLPLVRGADLQATPVGAYAQYYTGLALAGLGRLDEAQKTLAALDARDPAGYLEEAVPMQLAEIASTALDTKEALDQLEDLSDEKLSSAGRSLSPPRPRCGSRPQSRKGARCVSEGLLRFPPERTGHRCAIGDRTTRDGVVDPAGSLQAGTEPRRAAVHRAAVGAGAGGLRATGARGFRRRPQADRVTPR